MLTRSIHVFLIVMMTASSMDTDFLSIRIDVDECDIGRHNCSIADNEECENEVGSYRCECVPGFARLGESCEGENIGIKFLEYTPLLQQLCNKSNNNTRLYTLQISMNVKKVKIIAQTMRYV